MKAQLAIASDMLTTPYSESLGSISSMGASNALSSALVIGVRTSHSALPEDIQVAGVWSFGHVCTFGVPIPSLIIARQYDAMQDICSTRPEAFATSGAQALQELGRLSPDVWALEKEKDDMLYASQGIGIRQLRPG